MREWQSLPQVLHVYAVCWTLLIRSFLRVRLLVAACVSFSSPVLRCLVTAPLHCDRSAASNFNKFGFFTLICCHGVVENFSTFSGRIVPQFSSSICTAASDLLSVLCEALCY